MRAVINNRQLRAGDVTMCIRSCGTGDDQWNWTFFAVYMGDDKPYKYRWRCLSKDGNPFVNVGTARTIRVLEPDEYPDGVIAQRAALILEGEIKLD